MTQEEKPILSNLCIGHAWDNFIQQLANSFETCSVCSDKVTGVTVYDIRRWRSQNRFQFYLRFRCNSCGEAKAKIIVDREREKGLWEKRRIEEHQHYLRLHVRFRSEHLEKLGYTVDQIYEEILEFNRRRETDLPMIRHYLNEKYRNDEK